jgi:hypothetical protein
MASGRTELVLVLSETALVLVLQSGAVKKEYDYEYRPPGRTEHEYEVKTCRDDAKPIANRAIIVSSQLFGLICVFVHVAW